MRDATGAPPMYRIEFEKLSNGQYIPMKTQSHTYQYLAMKLALMKHQPDIRNARIVRVREVVTRSKP